VKIEQHADVDVRAIWNNGRIPTIAIPPTGKLRIRVPFNTSNRAWLSIGRTDPEWDKAGKFWTAPRSWLNRMSKHIADSYGQIYLIQSVRDVEKCAPACWTASGVDCDCPCLGSNHGCDNDDSWFVVSESYACRWGERRYSCRLIALRSLVTPDAKELMLVSGIQWKTYFLRAGQLTKIGRSTDVPARIRTLQTGCPSPIRLIALLEGDRESEWHQRFAEHRVHGEWFNLGHLELEQVSREGEVS
jgi:hypothetical protein